MTATNSRLVAINWYTSSLWVVLSLSACKHAPLFCHLLLLSSTEQNEPFAPVLNILKLPTVGTPAFLTAATAFANDGLWGSLSATFVVSPQEEGLHAEAVQTVGGVRSPEIASCTP